MVIGLREVGPVDGAVVGGSLVTSLDQGLARYFFLIIDPNGKIIGESVINAIDWDLRRANFRICTGLNWTSSLLIPARKKPTCGLVSSGREFCGMQFSTGASTLTVDS